MNVLLRACLALWPALCVSAAIAAAADEKPPRPNVLFIAIDDMGTKLGCYGFAPVKTPHFDRLAARGVLFERAFCNYPVCMVSRASFLSGRRPETPLEPGRFAWLPEHFDKHGYFTAEIGKVAHSYGVTRESVKWDLSEYEAQWKGRATDDEKHIDGRRTLRAIELMEQHRDEPFFLAVGFQKPHSPHRATPKYHAMYDPASVALPDEPKGHLAGIPPVALENLTTAKERNRSADERRKLVADYYACETFIDAQVGMLLDAIDRLKIAENTIVVIFGDHGLHLGEHGGMYGKRSLFEESMSVPLIVAAPGARQGARSPRLVELVDLYPTLVELCGLPQPEGLEGTSFAPLLVQPDKAWKPAVFGNVERAKGPGGKTVRTERYRYSEWGGPETAQLYDLAVDPREYVNLAAQPDHAKTLAEMRRLLKEGWQAARPVAAAPRNESRPNFVVVVVDDLRWDELGCAGNRWTSTPVIDRLAADGAMFRNAFCTTPLCSPARASLLTGLYAHRHGIIDNTDRSPRSHELVTFPRLLRDAGYATAFLGKWHMGNDDTPRPGFDRWVGLAGQGVANDPELNIDGKTEKVPGYVTDILTDEAVRFIRGRKDDRPFCLYIAQKALHPNVEQFADGRSAKIGAGGFIPAERHQNLYAGATIVRRPNTRDGLEGKPALARAIEGLPPLVSQAGTPDEDIIGRHRMLKSVDEGLGRILDALRETKLLDDTVIVVTSDHGYFYGEHHLGKERRLAYEEAIRVPLIVRFPRIVRGGSQPAETVLGLDLAPTLLELAGAAIPEDLDGRSFAPLLRGERFEPRDAFLVEYWSDVTMPRIKNMGYRAVRTDRWKHIQYAELEGMDELYDLRADPFELENLVGDAAHADALAKLRETLKTRWRTAHAARTSDRNEESR